MVVVGETQIQHEGNVFSIKLGEELPDLALEPIARYTFEKDGDISIYKLGEVYVVTLYDMSSEVIWGLATDPFEALDIARESLLSNYVDDLVSAVKTLLQSNDEETKAYAEKVINEVEELKHAFGYLADELRNKLNK